MSEQDIQSLSGGDSDSEFTSGSEHEILMNDSDSDRASSTGDADFTDESSSGLGGSSSAGGDEESGPGDHVIVASDDHTRTNNPNSQGGGGDNTDFYFEGVEKLLEIWFTRADGKVDEESCCLRKIPRYQLEEMLKLVHCEIIDSVSNEEIDSYVLSESSLFVSQRRLILKTCGTTTPLQCLKFLWTLANDYTAFDCIEDVYYSHKNYKRPQLQKMPYRKFENEVQLLDDFFAGSGGSAYCLGSMNRDCWYLYTYHAPLSQKHHQAGILHHRWNHNLTGQPHVHHHQRYLAQLNSQHGAGARNKHHHHQQRVASVTAAGPGRISRNHHHYQNHHHNNAPHPQMVMVPEPDQTLEILMSELDPSVMQIFTQKHCKTAEEATVKSGIRRIIPGMIINDHLFEPCGYSMNGIIQDQGTYMTIHITPESDFSYVSFETNIALSSYKDVIGRVLEIFRPGKFVMTFFANKASKGYPSHQEMTQMEAIKDHWVRMDNQFCRLEKHDLTYAMYTKFPS